MSEYYVENGLQYLIHENSVSVAGLEDTQMKTVNIPSVIQDKPVKIIRACAFEQTDVEEVYFPQTVVSIGERAFDRCVHLRYIAEFQELKPSSISKNSAPIKIRRKAFANCVNLTGFASFRDVSHVSTMAFLNCKKLTSIFSRFQIIRNEAFSGCLNLTGLKLSENPELGKNCFINAGVGKLQFSGDAYILPQTLEEIKKANMTIACSTNSNLVNLAFEGFVVEIV